MGAVLDEIEDRLLPLLAARTTEMPVVPEGARAATLNINSIHGGQVEPLPGDTSLPAPCVADGCRIVLDRRFLIEEALPEVKAEVTRLLDGLTESRPDFRYSLRDLFEVQPSMTARGGRSSALRPAHMTRSTSTGSGGCRTASPMGRAGCTWRISRTNGSGSRTWSTVPRSWSFFWPTSWPDRGKAIARLRRIPLVSALARCANRLGPCLRRECSCRDEA